MPGALSSRMLACCLCAGFVVSDLPEEGEEAPYRRVDVFHSASDHAQSAAVSTRSFSGCVHLRVMMRQDASIPELRAALVADLSRTLECRIAVITQNGVRACVRACVRVGVRG